jgi:protoporphyrinogen oxidase
MAEDRTCGLADDRSTGPPALRSSGPVTDPSGNDLSPDPTRPEQEVVIIGAGPAGLTAAYELNRRGVTSTVLEATDMVGGISRTVERDGWRFDIGGHRFFTKVPEVEAFWHEILPDEDFLMRPRMSRVYYRTKYFNYPIEIGDVFRNFGLVEIGRIGLSYIWARINRPSADEQRYLEGWISARFGRRLYGHLFKSYNEKLWGRPASEISADFAAQRIKNLTVWNAFVTALRPKWLKRRGSKQITSLIEEFQYPKYGPGMMWEVCRDKVEAAGTKVVMQAPVVRIEHADGRAHAVVTSLDGVETSYACTDVISSMPFPELLEAMDPPASPEALAAAKGLTFRDFATVALIVPEEYSFPDNWIYIHAPEVKVGRIQNFGSWSPYLIKEGRTCLGLEYFVFEGDEFWNTPDHVLVERAKHELDLLGLTPADKVEAGYVVRMPKAYPVYDHSYKENVETIRAWLATHASNVHPVGRNGMHKYNNQDHSMFTAMLTVQNIVEATHHDIWAVNVEQEYHEEKAGEGPEDAGLASDEPVLLREDDDS